MDNSKRSGRGLPVRFQMKGEYTVWCEKYCYNSYCYEPDRSREPSPEKREQPCEDRSEPPEGNIMEPSKPEPVQKPSILKKDNSKRSGRGLQVTFRMKDVNTVWCDYDKPDRSREPSPEKREQPCEDRSEPPEGNIMEPSKPEPVQKPSILKKDNSKRSGRGLQVTFRMKDVNTVWCDYDKPDRSREPSPEKREQPCEDRSEPPEGNIMEPSKPEPVQKPSILKKDNSKRSGRGLQVTFRMKDVNTVWCDYDKPDRSREPSPEKREQPCEDRSEPPEGNITEPSKPKPVQNMMYRMHAEKFVSKLLSTNKNKAAKKGEGAAKKGENTVWCEKYCYNSYCYEPDRSREPSPEKREQPCEDRSEPPEGNITEPSKPKSVQDMMYRMHAENFVSKLLSTNKNKAAKKGEGAAKKGENTVWCEKYCYNSYCYEPDRSREPSPEKREQPCEDRSEPPEGNITEPSKPKSVQNMMYQMHAEKFVSKLLSTNKNKAAKKGEGAAKKGNGAPKKEEK